MTGGLLMFLVPAGDGSGTGLLVWRDTQKMAWGILFLFGGGLCLAEGLENAGVIQAVGASIASKSTYGVLLVFVLIALSVVLSEFMSNVALVQIFVPVIFGIADGLGIATIVDNEPRISINNVSGSEGNGKTTSFTFTVRLSAAYDQAVTVNFATANGSATAGSDYQAKTGSVTFAPGETTKTITIVVIGDKTSESNEYFFVDLFGPSSNAFINTARGVGTILNDDRH
jgi:hypothetical protein